MLVRIFPESPNPKAVNEVVSILQKGGIAVFPTDTVYALGCDIHNYKAVEQICKLKGIVPQTANLSFLCSDIAHASQYTKTISNRVFKLMKHNLPGPFTFIIEANSEVPKLLKNKKKTVGIRIPNNAIIQAIIKQLGNPILSTSIHDEDQIVEYSTDPELIYERYQNIVDVVVDGGYGSLEASTVVDCLNGEVSIIRQGMGELIEF